MGRLSKEIGWEEDGASREWGGRLRGKGNGMGAFKGTMGRHVLALSGGGEILWPLISV